MGDYANDTRRGEQPGHDEYPKPIDGIIRQNARREVAAVGANTFQGRIHDGVVVINIEDEDGIYNLPPLNMVKPGQEIRVCAVDPAAGGVVTMTVNAHGTDRINENTPAAAVVWTLGATSAARKFQRNLSAGMDSWYVCCCLEELA